MKIFYHRTASGNVGDDLNAILWKRIIPNIDQLSCADWLIGIGSIIDQRLVKLDGRKLVVGSGFRPDSKLHRFPADIKFACVRGPLSAANLGLPKSSVACDPGFLIGSWPELALPKKGLVGLIPHIYSEARTHISSLAQANGLEVISPQLPVDTFLRRLAGCDRIFTESLHGAIFADALRIPWARTKICSHYYEGSVADFKWADAFAPMGVTPRTFNRIPVLPSSLKRPRLMSALLPLYTIFEHRLIEQILENRDNPSAFQLSADRRVADATSALLERIRQLVATPSIHPPTLV